MQNKNILVLGVGGHGWSALTQFIYECQNNIDFYFLTVDYGGSGGVWYRLLEFNDFELNKKLHNGSIKPILPWGDFNKVITRFFVHRYGKLGGEILDFRSDNLDEHLAEIDMLGKFLAMDFAMEEAFINYFVVAFEYYLKYKDELDYKTDKGFCLGYVLHDFLHWNYNKVSELSLFYRESGILPNNLKLYFTSENRQILSAKSTDNKKLIGEHLIDTYQQPILPENMEVLNTNLTKAKLEKNLEMSLKSAETVILPTGSIANWLPLINQTKIAKILTTKKVIWLVNPSQASNEFTPEKYLKYLEKKEISPFSIGKKNLLKNIISVETTDANQYDEKSVSQVIMKLL